MDPCDFLCKALEILNTREYDSDSFSHWEKENIKSLAVVVNDSEKAKLLWEFCLEHGIIEELK